MLCAKCNRSHYAKGLCRAHYEQMRYQIAHPGAKEYERQLGRQCKVLGCPESAEIKGRCEKHHKRWLRRQKSVSDSACIS